MPGGIAPGGSIIGPPGGGAFIAGEARFSRSMLPSRMIARMVPRRWASATGSSPGASRVETSSSRAGDRGEVLVVAIGQVDHLDHEVARDGLVEVLVGER